MIVVRTIASGVWSHAGVRATEWIGALPLIGIGYVLWDEVNVFGVSPSFEVVRQWANESTWSNVLLAVGVLRLFALIINGSFQSFRHSPTIRVCASIVAALSWSAFATGFFQAWTEYGGAPTAWVAYGTLTILELRNVYVARVDMSVTRGMANARTKR